MAIIGLLRRANQRRSGMRHQPMVLLALVLASFGVIAARLIWLQLIEGSRYRELADCPQSLCAASAGQSSPVAAVTRSLS